ncbi:set and mynd domain containing protein [Planoprotostelium fungivorum]|uniref:Set and mynd domain containing protein n=1 Tax=Planoprotostelium fungivorum TaxID=1890364 RepID=A0A2P6N0M0_9EUKA|nr:set and mynd domain containing protein [Planoprotostelium fungivorum]
MSNVIERWINNNNTGEGGSSTVQCGIGVESTPQKGRYLVALRPLRQGELIARAVPYILAVNQKRLRSVCDYCFRYNLRDFEAEYSISCDQCDQVFYCSTECKEKAIESYHRAECESFKAVVDDFQDEGRRWNNKKRDQLLCLGKILIRCIIRKDLEMCDVDAETIDRRKQFTREKGEGEGYHYTYSDLMELCTNLDSLPRPKLEMLETVSKIVHSTMKETCKDIIKRHKITSKKVFELACREESNAFGLYLPYRNGRGIVTEDDEGGLFAFGFYPLISLCNHSCSPNIYKMLEGTTYVYRALHDIPQGTELCHSYIDLYKNTNQRRTELRNNYGFTCSCDRCEDENTLEDPFSETHVCSRYMCGGLYIDVKGVRRCHRCGEEREE